MESPHVRCQSEPGEDKSWWEHSHLEEREREERQQEARTYDCKNWSKNPENRSKTQKIGGKTQKTGENTGTTWGKSLKSEEKTFPWIHNKHRTQHVDKLVHLPMGKIEKLPIYTCVQVCVYQCGWSYCSGAHLLCFHLASEAKIEHFCLLPTGKQKLVWSSQTVNCVFRKEANYNLVCSYATVFWSGESPSKHHPSSSSFIMAHIIIWLRTF